MGAARSSGGSSGLVVALVLALTMTGSAVLAAPADGAPGGSAAPSAAAGGDADDTRLLVTYERPNSIEAAVASLAAANITPLSSPDIGVTGNPGASAEAPGAGVGATIASSSVQVLDFADAPTAAQAADLLAGQPNVVSVEPDVLIRAHNDPLTTSSPTSNLDKAWWLRNSGAALSGVQGRRGADIGAIDVWPRATGKGVVVAVIDTGADINHPALRDRLWHNPGERIDGRDSDGNGFVDDVHGYNFAGNNATLYNSEAEDFHGTHVAGLVAGAAHEATGAAGVAPGAELMILKFIDGEAGRTSDAIRAIEYAVANGADVINASWGSSQPSNALRTVLASLEIPFVVSAGNTGEPLETTPSYPASWGLPNVISVSAVDHTGALASFSAYSRDLVDVAAPGVRIAGPYPGGRYATASGTSQAAPLVSGAVALVLQRHPGLSSLEVAEAVRATVRPLSLVGDTRSGGLMRAPALLDHLGTRVPACTTTGDVVFSDVRSDSVHHDAVACMVALGVTVGTTSTTYGSEDGLTAAQIATMTFRALQRADVAPPVPATGRFSDVPAGSTHRDAIEALAAVGVVRGSSTSIFGPDRIVTREEFAGVVARAAEFVTAGEVRPGSATFIDLASVSDPLEIRKAAWIRVTLGKADGTFDPETPVRRDQAASMVTRLLDRLTQHGLMDAA